MVSLKGIYFPFQPPAKYRPTLTPILRFPWPSCSKQICRNYLISFSRFPHPNHPHVFRIMLPQFNLIYTFLSMSIAFTWSKAHFTTTTTRGHPASILHHLMPLICFPYGRVLFIVLNGNQILPLCCTHQNPSVVSCYPVLAFLTPFPLPPVEAPWSQEYVLWHILFYWALNHMLDNILRAFHLLTHLYSW